MRLRENLLGLLIGPEEGLEMILGQPFDFSWDQ